MLGIAGRTPVSATEDFTFVQETLNDQLGSCRDWIAKYFQRMRFGFDAGSEVFSDSVL